jgi:branched-chain amino acid transport system substrate-binding protein
MLLSTARKRATAVHFGALVLAAVYFFAAPADAQIKIGEINPISGAIGQYGTTCHRGIALAVEDVNAQGGVLGQRIELITEDNQSQPGQAATIARKFVTQDKVLAIVGDLTSSATLAAAPIAQQAGVPLVTPTATNPKVTQVGDFIFRICFIDEFQGKVMARFAAEQLKLTKAAVLTDVKQDYSVGLSRFFEGVFTQAGGTVVKTQSYSSGDTDFRAQLTGLRAARPETVFLPGYYPEVGVILRQARQLGLSVPFLGCEAWDNPTLLQVAGKAADGCYFSNHFSADDPAPAVAQFVAHYRQKHGDRPDTFAALGYDAAALLFDAIKRAGKPEPVAVRDALAQTRDYPGATGTITINAQRNASKPAVILKIQDGHFIYFQKVTPDSP